MSECKVWIRLNPKYKTADSVLLTITWILVVNLKMMEFVLFGLINLMFCSQNQIHFFFLHQNSVFFTG
jgi:hypothetical protein